MTNGQLSRVPWPGNSWMLDALFVRHTQQMYIYSQREYVEAHS